MKTEQLLRVANNAYNVHGLYLESRNHLQRSLPTNAQKAGDPVYDAIVTVTAAAGRVSETGCWAGGDV